MCNFVDIPLNFSVSFLLFLMFSSIFVKNKIRFFLNIGSFDKHVVPKHKFITRLLGTLWHIASEIRVIL